MAKSRTKAQRSAAAKASWARRRLQSANKPTPVPAEPVEERVVYMAPPPKIAYAVTEGDSVFVCFGEDGSLRRERISHSLAKKLLRELAAILTT